VLSAWVMLIVGGTYVVFGIFCLQRVMERVRREEKERWDEYREEVERKERKLRADEERELLLESDDDCEGRVLSDEEGIGVMFCGKWERCRRKCLKKRRRGKGFFLTIGLSRSGLEVLTDSSPFGDTKIIRSTVNIL